MEVWGLPKIGPPEVFHSYIVHIQEPATCQNYYLSVSTSLLLYCSTKADFICDSLNSPFSPNVGMALCCVTSFLWSMQEKCKYCVFSAFLFVVKSGIMTFTSILHIKTEIHLPIIAFNLLFVCQVFLSEKFGICLNEIYLFIFIKCYLYIYLNLNFSLYNTNSILVCIIPKADIEK